MKIYQIFYDAKSKKYLDKEFIPFDNSNPQFNGWYEYSAIRRIFNQNEFGDDEYVGILSPRFYEKTGLSGADLLRVLEKSRADVINFSPRFDQIAYYQNAFFQLDAYNHGFLDICNAIFIDIGLEIDLRKLIGDQSRTIFSNYFVAKHSFWKRYLVYSERLFKLSYINSESGNRLNVNVKHRNGLDYTSKVFIMERLICAVMEVLDVNAEIGIDYSKFLEKNRVFESIFTSLLTLDSYKSSFLKTGKIEYLHLFELHRRQTPLNQILHGIPGLLELP